MAFSVSFNVKFQSFLFVSHEQAIRNVMSNYVGSHVVLSVTCRLGGCNSRHVFEFFSRTGDTDAYMYEMKPWSTC
ncbi:hypothetical protein OPV22_017130 [Ensete ventricosum]|uniref:Uncharacterized protein n=1 Tax=Ensete ventricosum TaxID=4639 RepID=A0AAV8PEY8_ENSVE|nr:hypothetical protein OPV22_017130 [Ensete ventricosum]